MSGVILSVPAQTAPDLNAALLRHEHRAAVAVVREQLHERARLREVALRVFVDEDVDRAALRDFEVLEKPRYLVRIDELLADEEALRRIAYRRIVRVQLDLGYPRAHAARVQQAHVEDRPRDDADERVAAPQLQPHDERAREIRPRGPPLEAGIRIEDERADYDRRDEVAEAGYPLRNLPVLPREQEERQRAQSVVHGEPRRDYAEHVDDFGLHFAARSSSIFPTRTASSGVSTPTPSSCVRTTAIFAPIQSALSCSSFSVFSRSHGGSLM